MLSPALARAFSAWERADDLKSIDGEIAERLATARVRLQKALASPMPQIRAVGLEAVLALRGACGLVDLIERRLSPLIRLRVRSEHKDLLPDGRPFLDVGGALAEAAREWS